MSLLEVGPILAIRRSFRWKLLVALLGSVALLALVMLVVVRWETAQQIERVTAAAEQRTERAFIELEQFNRAQVTQRSIPFTGSLQAAAALEAALETGDVLTLAADVNYEFQARSITQEFVAFTDANAEPVLTLLNHQLLDGPDPGGVRETAERVLFDDYEEARAYRTVAGGLYSVETLRIDLGRPIGTVTIGVAITHADAERLGSVVGSELCFVVDGRCVAGTERARAELEEPLVAMVGAPRGDLQNVAGERWRVIADPLTPDDDHAWRVIAVPLEEVMAPFERVQRALLLGGLGALILATLLAMRLARNLTRPVLELVAATERLGAGEFDTRVDVRAIDEMGVLATAFNEMAAGLALKERYRGLLDKVVSPDVAAELLKGEVVLGGESREVTVVFADVTGFTRITEGMQPARVIALVNEVMELLTGAVEAFGGVVDKYVGDEIMVLFGAPVARGEDAFRACQAALAMQEAMDAMNTRRVARGDPRLDVSIGMNTAHVMAGNMGSANRLNYTVIGDGVNMAARIEALAGPGQVLITEHTLWHVRDRVRVRALGLHELKGFTRAVEVFELLEVTDPAPAGQPSTGVSHAVVPLLASLLVAAAPGPAPAQLIGELPTLESVYFSSTGGAIQAGFSGRLDLEGYLPQDDPAWIIPTTEPFFAPRLRVFGDAFLGDRVITSAELRLDRGEEPAGDGYSARLEQLFVRILAGRGTAVQAGKFVSPFGGWAQRHHTVDDPFIRPPLPYDYRTVLSAAQAPVSAGDLLAWKDLPERWRPTGAPVIWGAPYQWGAMLMGHAGRIDWRAAAVNSAPSSEPEEWGLARGFAAPSYIGHAGIQLSPAVRLALSHNRGPWLRRDAAGVPVGMAADDYEQRLWGAEAVFRYAHTKLRGEVFHDTWGVPNVGYGVVDVSWYLEAEQQVLTGLALAVRAGSIHFLEVRGTPDLDDPDYAFDFAAPWDYDVRRLQLAAGYRVARNAGVRTELTLNGSAAPSPPRDNLFAVQLWWEF